MNKYNVEIIKYLIQPVDIKILLIANVYVYI